MGRKPGDTPLSRRAALARGTQDAAPATTTVLKMNAAGNLPASPHTVPGAWQVGSPESEVRSNTHLLRPWHVEKIVEVLISSPQEGPHGAGTLVDIVHLSLTWAVPKEGPIEAGIRVLHQLHLQHRRENSCHGYWEAVLPVSKGNVFHLSGKIQALLTQLVTLVLSSLSHRAGQRGDNRRHFH